MFDARLPADSISLAFLEIYRRHVNIVALPHYLKKFEFYLSWRTPWLFI